MNNEKWTFEKDYKDSEKGRAKQLVEHKHYKNCFIKNCRASLLKFDIIYFVEDLVCHQK